MIPSRYHVVGRVNEAGKHVAALVRARPSPLAPDDPKQDIKDGPALFEGESAPGSPFWAAVLESGFIWTGSFKRYWEHNPQRAERIQQGESQ